MPGKLDVVRTVTLFAGRQRLPIMAALLVGPFVVLGLSARRFGPILAVVAAPVLARGLIALAGQIERWFRPDAIRALAAGAAFIVVAATGLALANAGARCMRQLGERSRARIIAGCVVVEVAR